MLRATHIDHAPLEVEVIVSNRAEMVLDFALELRPVKLPPVPAGSRVGAAVPPAMKE